MSIVHGRQPEGEEVKGTNPILIGVKDSDGNAMFLAMDEDGKIPVKTDLVTDVTIHDADEPESKLHIDEDGNAGVIEASAATILEKLEQLEGKLDSVIADGKVSTQILGSIPEYNWFASEGDRPVPVDHDNPAIGVEVDATTGDMTGLLWNGESWEEI